MCLAEVVDENSIEPNGLFRRLRADTIGKVNIQQGIHALVFVIDCVERIPSVACLQDEVCRLIE